MGEGTRQQHLGVALNDQDYRKLLQPQVVWR